MYLSPAFSPRDPGELEFLRSVNPKTGFSLFWIDIVRPLLEHCGARHLVEVGAGEGEHTSLLLEYCEGVDGSLVVIEPEVRRSLRRRLERSSRGQLIAARSHDGLPQISGAVDAVLLEGDLACQLRGFSGCGSFRRITAWGSSIAQGTAAHYVASNLEVPRAVVRFLETWEIARLNDRIWQRKQMAGDRTRLVRAAKWPAKLLRRFARLVIPRWIWLEPR